MMMMMMTMMMTMTMMMMIVCVQLLTHISVHIAVSLYSLTGLIAAILSLLLPIETKGRQMMVRFHIYITTYSTDQRAVFRHFGYYLC